MGRTPSKEVKKLFMGPHDVHTEKFSKTVSKCTNLRPKSHPNIHGNFVKTSTYTHMTQRTITQ